MLSSLGIRNRTFAGPQSAPAGSTSPFLTLQPQAPVWGSNDLTTLVSQTGAQVQGDLVRKLDRDGGMLGRIQMPLAGVSAGFNLKHFADGNFTEKTIENMHKAVLLAKTDANWRDMMERIRQLGRKNGAIGWKDYAGELRWFDHWYRGPHFIDYVRDPNQVELVMHPALVYSKGLGDCDDSSSLFAASLGALGAAHRFRTYKADPKRPNDWSHVVSQIHIPNQGWVNDDLTIRGAWPGFEPVGFEFKDWYEPRWA